VKDAIAREDPKGPYVNIIAVRSEDKNKPWVKALVELPVARGEGSSSKRSSRARCSRPGKVLLFPPPCGEGGRPLGRSGGGATSGALTWGNPHPGLRFARPTLPA
jgi:hypothetical protein